MTGRGLRLAVLGSAAAIAVVGISASAGAEMLQSIGEGEGEVSIVAWPGYIERGESDPAYDWVTGFEKETGCKVTVKTAGSSDEMVSLMNGGGFDLVTASGDASLRLIAGGTVQEDQHRADPDLEQDRPASAERAPGTRSTASITACHGSGAPTSSCTTPTCSRTRRKSWSVVFEEQTLPDGKSNKGRVQAYYGPIYIADAALYLMTNKPELGITDPYALTQAQFDAAVELLREQRQIVQQVLVRRRGPDRRLHQRRRGRLDLLAVSGQHCCCAGGKVDRLDRAEGRCHRLGRHHDDARRGAASELRLQVAQPLARPMPRPTRPPGSAASRRCPAPASDPILTDDGCKTNGFAELRPHPLLEDAGGRLRRRQGGVRALQAIGSPPISRSRAAM